MPRDKEKEKARKKEYELRPEVIVRRRKNRDRPENKEKAKEYNKEYNSIPENIAKKKEYDAKPETKEKRKKNRDRPENKEKQIEKQKKYRHENKEKMKEYDAKPETKARKKERQSRPENIAKAKKYERGISEKIIAVLGSKCESCGETYTRGLKKRNLEIHHKFYTEQDKEDMKKYGYTKQKKEVLRMIKTNKINELKKKYTLLCTQCNVIEAWVRKDKVKSFETFCWLYGEGYFDEALKDDVKFKKLSEFMK